MALWLRLFRYLVHLRNGGYFWKGDLCSEPLCYVRRVISIEIIWFECNLEIKFFLNLEFISKSNMFLKCGMCCFTRLTCFCWGCLSQSV